MRFGKKKMMGRIILLLIIVLLILPLIVMGLWNYVMPNVFSGIKSVTYLQAMALLALCRILFGRGPGRRGKRFGPGKFMGKGPFGHLSAEERAKIRERFRQAALGESSGDQKDAQL